ncbi:MAG: hypothetical protein IKY46_00840, partial [Clostridia bacterium]|nr:hypothetical protein [Clostridia bacterium]
TQETRAALTSILVEKNADLTGGTYYIVYEKGDDTKWYQYDTTTGGLKTATEQTVAVTDTIYTSKTTGSDENITASPDILDVKTDDTDNTKKTTVKELPDLSANVEILFVPTAG